MREELREENARYEEANEEKHTVAPCENSGLRHKRLQSSLSPSTQKHGGRKNPQGPSTYGFLTGSLPCYVHSRHV